MGFLVGEIIGLVATICTLVAVIGSGIRETIGSTNETDKRLKLDIIGDVSKSKLVLALKKLISPEIQLIYSGKVAMQLSADETIAGHSFTLMMKLKRDMLD